MNIDTNELDHIAQLLADAKTLPLKERIQRLEKENERLKAALSAATNMLPKSIHMTNTHFDGPMYDVHGNEEVKLED